MKIWNGLVFAGYGPYLHVYDYQTGELVNKCRIFARNKIHGVQVSGRSDLLLYGATSVSIVSSRDASGSSDLCEKERVVDGWVTSGNFNLSGDQTYILTSYNKVLVSDLEGNVKAVKGLEGENSILYSGSISVLESGRVLVNSGTVMGGVLIWDLHKEKLLHNLKGHEGSIFYVTISENGRYVASCSDDRSVRLWDLEKGTLLSVGWGHTARIWNLKFFDNSRRLISVSEDCTCRIWEIAKKEKGEVSLEQQEVHEVHLTKNIWGVDVDSNGLRAVTSGNDGRLKYTNITNSSTDNEDVSYTLKVIGEQANIDVGKSEIMKGFHWFEFGLVAITSQGKVMLFDSSSSSWSHLLTDDRFTSFSITHGIPDHNVITFANNKSELLILKFDDKKVVARTKVQVPDLVKTNNCMVIENSSTTFLVFLESPNPRENFVCMEFSLETLALEKTYRLKRPENFVSSCLEVYQHFLFVGSRYSALALFDLRDSEYLPYVIQRLTTGDTTTSIRYVESLGNSQVFSVTNRDGYYTFIRINLEEAMKGRQGSHSIIHSNKVVRGFLEDAQFDENGEFITYGFKSSLFYIYNETSCYEVSSHVCGGAHRQWKLCKDSKGLILVYIKASALFFKRFSKNTSPDVLCAGIHGREIRDITIRKQEKYKDGYLFCTGSEDTTLKLMHVSENSGKVTNYWTQRKHVSGLQRCEFINKNLMISSSAREELFLWELNAEGNSRPYMALRQALPISSDNPDLRIMDFAVKFFGTSKDFILTTVYSDSAIKVWHYNYNKNTFTLVCDGRYKTCCLLNVALPIICDQLYLVVFPTDGFLVFYNISEYIPFEINAESKNLVDNELEVLLVGLPDYECRLQVHQSGIKCAEYQVENNNLFIYTGGDDNALGLSVAKLDRNTNKINPGVLDFQPQAAASTISSCTLVSDGTKLLTTSVDQVVKLWDVADKKLALHYKLYTTVSDTGSSDALKTKDLQWLALIGGVGLSAVKIEK